MTVRKLTALTIAIIIAMAVSVGASSAEDVIVCPLEEAMKRLEDYNIMVSAERAEKAMPILKEMRAINGTAKNPTLPLGTQLSKPDIDRFQQLREQLLDMDAHKIIDSGYLRDSRVITQAAKVAYDIAQGRTFDQNDPQFFYYSIVMLLSVQFPSQQMKVTTPQDHECTVEAGLHFYEQLMSREIERLPFHDASVELTKMAAEYNLDTHQQGWIDRIPSIEERQRAKAYMGTVNRGLLMLEYVNNIENLKALNRVSIFRVSV
jgi:hypothetical protein